eukprot:2926666-Rhodomonas_salina.1
MTVEDSGASLAEEVRRRRVYLEDLLQRAQDEIESHSALKETESHPSRTLLRQIDQDNGGMAWLSTQAMPPPPRAWSTTCASSAENSARLGRDRPSKENIENWKIAQSYSDTHASIPSRFVRAGATAAPSFEAASSFQEAETCAKYSESSSCTRDFASHAANTHGAEGKRAEEELADKYLRKARRQQRSLLALRPPPSSTPPASIRHSSSSFAAAPSTFVASSNATRSAATCVRLDGQKEEGEAEEQVREAREEEER